MADTPTMVHQRCGSGYYKNRDPYPSKPDRPVVLSQKLGDIPLEQLEAATAAAYQHANDMAIFNRQKEAWQKVDAERDALFEPDLAAAAGLTDHPKRAKLFGLAYEEGHHAGHSEVASHYFRMAELFKD